jgi:hypothetical protein
MNTKPNLDELFEHRINYPDFTAQERLARLVGLDDQKARLTKILSLLVNPSGLDVWVQKHHPGAKKLMDTVLRRLHWWFWLAMLVLGSQSLLKL